MVKVANGSEIEAVKVVKPEAKKSNVVKDKPVTLKVNAATAGNVFTRRQTAFSQVELHMMISLTRRRRMRMAKMPKVRLRTVNPKEQARQEYEAYMASASVTQKDSAPPCRP